VTKQLAKTRLADLRLHYGYDRRKISEEFQLRLVLENVGNEYRGPNEVKAAVHSVADDLLSCMAESERPAKRLEILSSVCKTVLACCGYWKLFYDLEDADGCSTRSSDETHSQDIQSSSFIVALASRYTKVQAAFLRVGLDTNLQTRYFGCPLQMASQFGFCDTVEKLLDSGANINRQAPWTALETAAWYGHIDVAKLLLNPKYNLRTTTVSFGEAACNAVKRGIQKSQQ